MPHGKHKAWAALALGICFAGCATWPGSVTAVVKPAGADGKSVVQCVSSSSGTCHVQIGERHASGWASYAIPAGGELAITLPDAPSPFCASHVEGWAVHCSIGPKTLVSKNGLTVVVRN